MGFLKKKVFAEICSVRKVGVGVSLYQDLVISDKGLG